MSSDLPQQIPSLMLVVFLASLLQGAVGFGFGLFSVAALSLLVELKTATPLLALTNLPVISYVFWKLRHAIVWRSLGFIISGMLVGIPFGIFVLVTWPQELLLRMLGGVLIISAVRTAVSNNAAHIAANEPWDVWQRIVELLVGLLVGALAGAFNTGGPPVIAYLYCRPGTKEQRTAALQAIFAISVVVRIIIMAAPPANLYTLPILIAAAACFPAGVVGSALGQRIFRRFPPHALEICVACFLLGIGLKLLLWPS
ncbi:MAG: sulfite exporter TauE/SafE family protein [Candidatus Zipacnadales bacterium]